MIQLRLTLFECEKRSVILPEHFVVDPHPTTVPVVLYLQGIVVGLPVKLQVELEMLEFVSLPLPRRQFAHGEGVVNLGAAHEELLNSAQNIQD